LANNKSKGKKISRDQFISEVVKLNKRDIPDGDIKENISYLIENFKGKKSIIKKVIDLIESDISVNETIQKIEEIFFLVMESKILSH